MQLIVIEKTAVHLLRDKFFKALGVAKDFQ